MSMSKPTQRASAAPGKNPKVDKEEEETTRQTEKTMDDLPPEVLTIILKHVILNQRRNDKLVYRLVNCQWKDIVNSLLEEEVISRRQMQVFPAIKIGGQSDQLSVYCPRAVFGTERNPLSFNSLLLNGHKDFPQDPADTQMTLPIFMSKFGSNLTTFALQKQIIGTKSLAAMLQSMSNLKVLRFEDVELDWSSIGSDRILQPPPLPDLTTLELITMSDYDDKINPLYVWLIASYADQLVYLALHTGESVPALQKSYEYSFSCLRDEKVSIATTSDSAFGKLKAFKFYYPSSQFLRFTQTPALTDLGVHFRSEVNLRDLNKLIGTCGSTLCFIALFVSWEIFETGKLIPSEGVVANSVKNLILGFDDYEEEERNIDKTFLPVLSMFPALEVIYLLHNDYSNSMAPQGSNLVSSGANESNDKAEIIYLKQHSASLREAALGKRRGDDDDDDSDDDDDDDEQARAWNRRISIFKRLATLGVNVTQLIVEQMLEKHGVWNICPNLKIVSVSSGEQPVGDISVIKRKDDA